MQVKINDYYESVKCKSSIVRVCVDIDLIFQSASREQEQITKCYSPHIISVNVNCPFLLYWEDSFSHKLIWSCTHTFRRVFPLAFLPFQQLARWPFWLLLQSFSRLKKSIYAGLAHFHWAVPTEGSSAGGDSCVWNLRHNFPCILVFILFLEWGSGRPVRGRPAVLCRSHLYWTRTRSICQPVRSSFRSGQAHMSPAISCVAGITTNNCDPGISCWMFYCMSSVQKSGWTDYLLY